jgi:uncharacterized protein
MGDINREPSMEEILASIKRVIAEDGRATGQPRVGRRPQPVAEAAPPLPAEPEGATTASRQALASLAALRAGGEPQLSAPAAAGDSPLEAAVKDMLRPMLKDWLDQRLPDLVEELVTREIARITGKHL